MYDMFMNLRLRNLLKGEVKNYELQKENTELKEKIKLLAKSISKQEFKAIVGNTDADNDMQEENEGTNLNHFG